MSANPSLFSEFTSKLYPKLARYFETVNKKRGVPTYYFKNRLRTEYSADQHWESANVDTALVAASMVAMDSELPVRKRNVLSAASGTLPKMGEMLTLNENQMNALKIMRAMGNKADEIVRKLADDAYKLSGDIDVRNEINFLTAMSDQYVLVANPDNATNGLRVEFNIPDGNKFGVTTQGSLTIDDIRRVVEAADAKGVTFGEIWIAESTFNTLKATREARELVAISKGQVFDSSTTLAVPTTQSFKDAFAEEFNGLQFEIVKTNLRTEVNGVRSVIKPFNVNKLTFVKSGELGALVWSTLAEQDYPVAGVNYSVIDGYKLISKYSETNPLREFTSVQAMCLPVLENLDEMYSIDITLAQEVDEEAETADTGDSYTTVFDNKYTKSSLISVMNGEPFNLDVATTATDAIVIEAINTLSVAKQNKLKVAIEPYIVS